MPIDPRELVHASAPKKIIIKIIIFIEKIILFLILIPSIIIK